MASSLPYVICARGADGTPLVGLTPAWRFLKNLYDGTDIASKPVITEIGFGQYKFCFDSETLGDSSGQIDLGANVTTQSRFIDVTLYRSESRLDSNLDVAISTRSTFAGGPVASVAAPVIASSVTSPVIAQKVTEPVVASQVTGSVKSVVDPVRIQSATIGFVLSN